MKYKAGDILLVGSNHLISRIIKKATKSEVNHAGLIVKLAGEFYVIEAERRGIQLTPIDEKKYNYLKPGNKEYWILRPKFKLDIDAITTLALEAERGKYDFISLIVWQPLLLITGRWFGKKNRGDNVFYCSEFVAWIYNKIYSLFPEWYEMNPKDLKTEYDISKFELIKFVKTN